MVPLSSQEAGGVGRGKEHAPGGVLFDLDGVLFDTEPLHRRAWMQAMRRLGHEIDEESLIAWTGIPCADLARHYEETLLPTVEWHIYHERKGEAFRRLIAEELRPYPGVPDLVREIASLCRVGHVTSNDRIDAELMLHTAGYAATLPVGVAYEDVTSRKPSPEPYLKAAGLFDLRPSRCIAVEDSPSGVASAVAAGMTVAAVTTTFSGGELADASQIFPDTAAACSWILAMLRSRPTSNSKFEPFRNGLR